MDRSEDWLRQAHYDLEAAAELRGLGRFAWSCFVAQQSAEKSMKAALEAQGLPTWGHDLVQLIDVLSEKIPVERPVREACFRLNLYYITTRYPDAFSIGVPGEKFSEEQSTSALADAQVVMEFAERLVRRR